MGPKSVDQVVVYEAGQRAKMGFFRSWVLMFLNILRSRELIWQLFKRDFFAGYKQSFLGVFWIFIAPLVGIVSWVFMNSTGILQPGELGVPYPVYVLLGSTFWGLFISFYMFTANSLSSGGGLILQVNFAHEALVAQQMGQALVNFSINVLLISLVLAVYRIGPHWQAIFLPLTLLPIFFVGSGIGMVVSVISVVVHDINKMVTAGLSLLFFLTPIVYGSGIQNPIIKFLSKWNPLVYLICAPRDLIIYGRIDNPAGYVISFGLALAAFLLSWRFFFLAEYKIAEKL